MSCGCSEDGAHAGDGPAVEEGGGAPAALPSPGKIEVKTPLRLTERGRVPEKEPGFLSAEVHGRTIVIAHDGRLPVLDVGDVIAGTQAGGYLARVTAVVEESEERVVLDTEPAALTELLGEGEIHVHYDALDYARRLGEAAAAAQALGDEDGEQLGSTAQALKASVEAPIQLLDLSHASLPASCGVKATGKADIDVNAMLIPSIDLDLKIGAKGGFDPTPELKKFRLVASGMLQVDAKLHGTGTLEGSCTVDLLKLAGGVPSVTLPPLTFWVGPVPVIITTEVVPVAKARVDLAFEAAEVTAETYAFAGLEAGVQYEGKQWSTVWDPWGHATGTASIEAPGDITASCKVSAGAELRSRLYGILGPNLGVTAYARATAGTAPPYCTYDGAIDGGVNAYAEAEAGVSVGPLDLTLVSLPLFDYELVHFDGPQWSGELRDAPECSTAL